MAWLKRSYLGSGGVLAAPCFFYVPHLEKKGYAEKNRLNVNVFSYDANGNIETQVRHDNSGIQIDNLTYLYHDVGGKRKRNRLYHVNDAVSEGTYSDDIDQQSSDFIEPTNTALNGSFVEADKVNSLGQHFNINEANNFVYDQSGQLIEDKQENLRITWRVDGKIKEIKTLAGVLKVRFEYDALGNRIAKHAYTSGVLSKTTFYVLDAQGNTMNVYEREVDNANATTNYKLAERHIYGSSRLGILTQEVNSTVWQVSTTFQEGDRFFEQNNHLGNVLSVVADKRKPLTNNSVAVTGFEAYIASSTDYSPFGVPLLSRTFESAKYRYSFQNQEHDDEIKGENNSVNYKYRMHDPRLGRFFCLDPLSKKYPHNSPYAFSENRVIDGVELEGLEFTSFDTDSKDPNVKNMAIWGGHEYSYRDSKYYQTFNDARSGFSGGSSVLLGMAGGAVISYFGLRATLAYMMEEVLEEVAGRPIIPDPGDGIQYIVRNSAAPNPMKVLPTDDLVSKASKRKGLATKRMGSESKTKYVDTNLPVYDKTYNVGDILYQYRKPGESEGKYFINSTDITPEQVGLLSSEYSEVYKVTINQKTSGLVSTHTKDAEYFLDKTKTIEGGGKQIYAPKINSSSATFEKIK